MEFLKLSGKGFRIPSFSQLRLFPSSCCCSYTLRAETVGWDVPQSKQQLQYTWGRGVAEAYRGFPWDISSLLDRLEKLADQEHPKLSQMNPLEPTCQDLTNTGTLH